MASQKSFEVMRVKGPWQIIFLINGPIYFCADGAGINVNNRYSLFHLCLNVKLESVASAPHSTSEFAWLSLKSGPGGDDLADVMVAWTSLICAVAVGSRHFLFGSTNQKTHQFRPCKTSSQWVLRSLSSLKGVFHAYFAWKFLSTWIELHQLVIYNLLTQETKSFPPFFMV